MKKSVKSKAAVKVDPYLEGLMAKLLDRLVGIEKQLSTVIAQTAGKPSGNGEAPKSFQKPETTQPPHRDRVLYEAICADCHKVCEVPFKPSENRAVYCKECFARRKSGGQSQAKAPLMTPVALAPKPPSKLSAAALSAAATMAARQIPKKKKSAPAKKAKKKK